MIERDIFALMSIFCDVDDFCKEFEPEWQEIMIEKQKAILIENRKQISGRPELSLRFCLQIIKLFTTIRRQRILIMAK